MARWLTLLGIHIELLLWTGLGVLVAALVLVLGARSQGRLDRRLTVPLALRSLREHEEIIAACQARNPDKAEAALVLHFNAALQRHLGIY